MQGSRVANMVIARSSDEGPARVFAINQQISKHDSLLFRFPLKDFEDLDHCGQLGELIVKRILEIEGVEAVRIEPYAIVVWIGIAFTWSQVEPTAITTLEQLLSKQLIVERRLELDPRIQMIDDITQRMMGSANEAEMGNPVRTSKKSKHEA